MKFLPQTQIDLILQKAADQNNKNLDSLFSNLIQPNKDNINKFDFDLLTTNNLLHIDQIKKVCIDYRLRFLDLKYFKGNIPATAIEKIELDKVDRFSYRASLGNFDYLQPYTFFATGLAGFVMASLYNAQRPVTYNEYGIPRKDLSVYRQIFGTIIGLIFSSEVFDAISTLLTPTDTIILSEAEYEKENY